MMAIKLSSKTRVSIIQLYKTLVFLPTVILFEVSNVGANLVFELFTLSFLSFSINEALVCERLLTFCHHFLL